MSAMRAVVGVFTYLDDTVKAIDSVKGHFEYRVYSPTINHEIEEATYPEKSPIRFFTFLGGATGITAGFTLAIMCSLDYPLRVSAKAIVSIPGFFVIGYECLILFAALATFGAMAHFCRIPDILRKVGYDKRFSNDKFGVVVMCDKEQVEDIKTKLNGCGADEVEVKDAL